jgi:hypothetical protein
MIDDEHVLSDLYYLLIERECERLGVLYTHFIDFGEAERITDLFTEDGVWEGLGYRVEGTKQLREFFKAR